jgi:ribosomal protein S18 acetylase RimI-like enzyme
MNSKTTIRPAREDQLPAVLELSQEADVTPPSASDSMEGLRSLIAEPNAILLVATIDGRVVGSVIGGWDGWRGNIYRLAVGSGHRRKGIARELVKAISSARH